MQSNEQAVLRTYTVMEILDRTFRIYRSIFLPCVGLVAAVTVPLTWLTWRIQQTYESSLQVGAFFSSSETTRLTRDFVVFFLIGFGLSAVQAIFVNSILTYIASERHFGRSASPGEAFRKVSRRLGVLFGGQLSYVLIVVGITLSTALVGTILASALALTLQGVDVISTALLAVPGIVLVGAVYLALGALLIPVLTLEQVSAVQGLRRAWELGKSRFLQVFRLSLAVGIIGLVVGFAIGLAQLIVLWGTIATFSQTTSDIITLIRQSVVNILLAPMLPIGMTLIYYDARVRFENLDLALMAVDKPDARPEDVNSPAYSGAWLKGKEVSNIAILFGLFIGIGILVYVLSSLLQVRG